MKWTIFAILYSIMNKYGEKFITFCIDITKCIYFIFIFNELRIEYLQHELYIRFSRFLMIFKQQKTEHNITLPKYNTRPLYQITWHYHQICWNNQTKFKISNHIQTETTTHHSSRHYSRLWTEVDVWYVKTFLF